MKSQTAKTWCSRKRWTRSREVSSPYRGCLCTASRYGATARERVRNSLHAVLIELAIALLIQRSG